MSIWDTMSRETYAQHNDRHTMIPQGRLELDITLEYCGEEILRHFFGLGLLSNPLAYVFILYSKMNACASNMWTPCFISLKKEFSYLKKMWSVLSIELHRADW